MNIIKQIIKFLDEVKIELNNISWLSRKQVIAKTRDVLLLSVIISLFLFGLDLIFEKILILLVQR